MLHGFARDCLPRSRASATTGRYTRFHYRRSETCFDRAVRYRGISIATAVEEEAARAFIAGCYDYFRSPLPYGNPSVIAGSSMKLESLNKRAAPNLSGRQVSGRCLCGAVKLEIDFPAFWAWHDHSTASRRAHGAAYATYIGCWRKHARVAKGRRSIARFEDATTESTRSFCSRCGTPLLYERKRSPHMVNIPRALFTGRTGREPRYHVACQGVDGDGQRHLQRLAHGRRLARQATRRGTAAPGRRR